ncbi:MAG: hypothetical protein ACJAY8_001209 [Sphingobacteriales bacterium]|jgi:hypothetical protein
MLVLPLRQDFFKKVLWLMVKASFWNDGNWSFFVGINFALKLPSTSLRRRCALLRASPSFRLHIELPSLLSASLRFHFVALRAAHAGNVV